MAQSLDSFYNNRGQFYPRKLFRTEIPEYGILSRERRKRMKLSKIGRVTLALVASVAIGLGMTACGGGTVGYLWVLGTQYNQIAAFKIDNFSGNLTQSPGSPFGSGGANPQAIAVKPGGRFVYVVNDGTPNPDGTLSGANISEFLVGGDGTLSFQQAFSSQGGTPVWAAMDTTGNFLYVLDRLDPTNLPLDSKGNPPAGATGTGDITVFAIAGDTGRLSLVTNAQVKVGNVNLNYFPVGKNPTMSKIGSSCLYTLDGGDNTVFPYAVNSTTGQLTLTTNSVLATGAAQATSINVGGSYVYVTDAGANLILPYSTGTSCALNSIVRGGVANAANTTNPVWTLTESKGQRLYVLNQFGVNTNFRNSTISAFNIQTDGTLSLIPGTDNPFATGAGPVCAAEDPTNQYLYTSNGTDGTITGFRIDGVTGKLNPLPRGSTFKATGLPSCLVISGNVG